MWDSLERIFMTHTLAKDVFQTLDIDPKRVWCLLGYDSPNKASPIIQKVFRQAMEIGPSLLEPAACFTIFPIKKVTPASGEVSGMTNIRL